MENEELKKDCSHEVSQLLAKMYFEKDISTTQLFDSIAIGLASFLAELSSAYDSINSTRKETLYLIKDYCIESLNKACVIVMDHEDFQKELETIEE